MVKRRIFTCVIHNEKQFTFDSIHHFHLFIDNAMGFGFHFSLVLSFFFIVKQGRNAAAMANIPNHCQKLALFKNSANVISLSYYYCLVCYLDDLGFMCHDDELDAHLA